MRNAKRTGAGRGLMAAVLIALVVLTMVLPARGDASAESGDSQRDAQKPRVLFLLGPVFNVGEFIGPYTTLRAAGYEIDIASMSRGVVPSSTRGPRPDRDAYANLSLDEVEPSRYLALVIPGGYSPGHLEKHERSLEICRAFMQAGKPIAAICHGPRLLMRAGLMDERVGTCLNSVKNELADAWRARAYGRYIDQPVVIDGNLITSRYPNDVPAFSEAIIKHLAFVEGGLPRVGVLGHRLNIVAPGTDGHQRWIIRQLGSLGMDVRVSDNANSFLNADAGDDEAGPPTPTYLAVLSYPSGSGERERAQRDAIMQLAMRGQRLLIAPRAMQADIEAKKAMPAASYLPATDDLQVKLRAVVKAIEATGPTPNDLADAEVLEEGEELPPLLYVMVREGYDGRAMAALRAFLDASELEYEIVSRGKPGWVRGTHGSTSYAEWSAVPGLLEGERRFDLTSPPRILLRLESGEILSSADNLPYVIEGAPAVWDVPLMAARGPWTSGESYLQGRRLPNTVYIAVSPGFDEQVVFGMWGMHKVNSGVVIVAHERGEVTGVNGGVVTATRTYADMANVADGSIVIAPGGLWPEKAEARQAEQPEWIDQQAQLDEARKQWLLRQLENPKVRMAAFGFDSLALGRTPRFADRPFASSDQTVWSFRLTDAQGNRVKVGKYSGEEAVRTTDNLITAKGASSMGEVLRLLHAPDDDGE